MNRLDRWRRAGRRAHILKAVSATYDGDVQMIDASSIRVHQHAANSQEKLRLKLTEGQAHDGRSAADMLETVEAGWAACFTAPRKSAGSQLSSSSTCTYSRRPCLAMRASIRRRSVANSCGKSRPWRGAA